MRPLRKAIDMFKDRVVQVTLPKKPASAEPTLPNPYLDPATMIPIVEDLTIKGAKLGFAIYAGVKVLSTVCDIAKIAAQAKL